tara:strand:+ start:189 stop:494 length:306 start_codon:yes stop_codon:yes gene_type:complete
MLTDHQPEVEEVVVVARKEKAKKDLLLLIGAEEVEAKEVDKITGEKIEENIKHAETPEVEKEVVIEEVQGVAGIEAAIEAVTEAVIEADIEAVKKAKREVT